MLSWQFDQVWKFEELSRCKVSSDGGLEGDCSNLKRQTTAYMVAYSDFRLVPKVTVTEWPTWLPYSRCSYLCRKPTEAGKLSLEWRSISLTLR